MKRFFAVMLVCAMLASLTSCSQDMSDVTGSVETNAQTTEKADDAFKQGTVSQKTYKNEFIGIGCTFDENWVFYSDEKIAELNGIAADAMDEEAAELIANADLVYDMFAENAETAENVNINLEKLTLAQVLVLDIEAMYETQAETIKSTYENMGSTEFSYTVGKMTFVGKEESIMSIKAKMNGIDMFQTIVSIKTGRYVTSVCATSYQTDTTKDILNKFFSI